MPSLNFKGKAVIETHHHTVPHHRLEFDDKLSELPKGEKPSLDGNLIIEGDNLVALKALLPTHAGRVKCIYIDPPYNTGEENWVFNDNLTQPQFKDWIGETVGKEGEDSTRHDKWCCMMYPRLALARQLLTDDGILFLSIGEDEVHHLRLAANELFNTAAPLITFVWRRRTTSGLRKDPVSIDHEYVLGYAADPRKVKLSGLVMGEEAYPFVEEDGTRYASTDLTIGATSEDRPNQFYPIKNPRTGVEYQASPNRVWRFEKAEMKKVIAADLIIWPDEASEGMTRPRYKTRYDPNNPKIRAVSSWIRGISEKVADLDSDSEEYDEDVAEITSGMTAEGGRVLRQIFGKKVFNYPKPPSLLKSLLRIATGDGDIVLDPTAGSGTTAHAVLELNRAEERERRFVLIQQLYDTKVNEEEKYNICEKITAERVRRVANGYKARKNGGKTEKVRGLGGSFSYARLGEPLFGEYRDFGKNPPDFETLAKYIFYTETSRQIDLKKIKRNSGFIGQTEAAGGTSYYLFYLPAGGEKGNEFSLDTLKRILKSDDNRNWVVYCEKFWMHEDELSAFEAEHNRRVRAMLIPFQLQ